MLVKYDPTQKRGSSLARPAHTNNPHRNNHMHSGRDLFSDFANEANLVLSDFGMLRAMEPLNIFPRGERNQFPNPNSIMRSMFGNGMMDNMFTEISTCMSNGANRNGPGKFEKHVIISETKIDKHGRPQHEKYQSSARGAFDNIGNKVVERVQNYKNTEHGYDKAAHEKMINNKGKKLVQERIRANNMVNTHEISRNLREDEFGQFDQMWDDMSNKIGFFSLNDGPRKSSIREPQYQQDFHHFDDNRRGDFMPIDYRGEDQPVHYNAMPNVPDFDDYSPPRNPKLKVSRRSNGIRPTIPNQRTSSNNFPTQQVSNNIPVPIQRLSNANPPIPLRQPHPAPEQRRQAVGNAGGNRNYNFKHNQDGPARAG